MMMPVPVFCNAFAVSLCRERFFPLESLLREAFSAKAAATREEWSLASIGFNEMASELKRSEASGNFSTVGEDECGLLFISFFISVYV